MSLIPALKTQWRITLALILRETHTRFGNLRLGYLWVLFEPIAHISIYIALFSGVGRKIPLEGSLAFFFISGLIPFFLYRNIASRVMSSYSSNKALFSFPQVTPFDACISRYFLEIVTSAIVLFILCAGLDLFNYDTFFNNLLSFSICIFSLSILGLSIGIISANILIFFPAYQNLYGSLLRVLYFTSGIFFIADMLPKQAIEILKYNPLLHFIEWARSALYPNFSSNIVNYEYIFWWVSICLFIALSSQRILFERARVNE